jgi:hypothetical protein
MQRVREEGASHYRCPGALPRADIGYDLGA